MPTYLRGMFKIILVVFALAMLKGSAITPAAKPKERSTSPFHLEIKPVLPLASDRLTTIIARIHNDSPQTAAVLDEGGVLRLFRVQVLRNGKPVPLTSYGREMFKPEYESAVRMKNYIASKRALTYQLKIGSLYDMSRNGTYTVLVSLVLNRYTSETISAPPLKMQVAPAPAMSTVSDQDSKANEAAGIQVIQRMSKEH